MIKILRILLKLILNRLEIIKIKSNKIQSLKSNTVKKNYDFLSSYRVSTLRIVVTLTVEPPYSLYGIMVRSCSWIELGLLTTIWGY